MWDRTVVWKVADFPGEEGLKLSLLNHIVVSELLEGNGMLVKSI